MSTISWMTASVVASRSAAPGSHRRMRPMAFSIAHLPGCVRIAKKRGGADQAAAQGVPAGGCIVVEGA
jgi:hypothetical protein